MQVAALFREHHDLLEEFTYFLPDTSGVVNPLSKAPGNSLPRRDDKVYSWPGPKQAQLGKVTLT
jgi:paired amphipathic helix protein Sin3a